MTQTDPTELAALLCSRLCHDLLSPIGALNNGIELLAGEKDPEMRQRCLDLLEQSASISANKLKFFRLAFGAAGGYGDKVSVEEPQALINALVSDNDRIIINWALADAEIPKPAVKLMLNLAQIGIEALIRGGTLDVGAETREEAGNTTSEIVIRASAQRIAFDEVIGQALDGTMPAGELTSRTSAAHMLHLLAENAGGHIQYHLADDALVLGATLPIDTSGMIG